MAWGPKTAGAEKSIASRGAWATQAFHYLASLEVRASKALFEYLNDWSSAEGLYDVCLGRPPPIGLRRLLPRFFI